jgi:hypothetical protein
MIKLSVSVWASRFVKLRPCFPGQREPKVEEIRLKCLQICRHSPCSLRGSHLSSASMYQAGLKNPQLHTQDGCRICEYLSYIISWLHHLFVVLWAPDFIPGEAPINHHFSTIPIHLFSRENSSPTTCVSPNLNKKKKWNERSWTWTFHHGIRC